ncbi:Adenylate cyclase [Cupriavidus basilensis]|uniref:Adenylate cyclase n=1 Tax=Cupriavidus basilensis TaxID=68895 RepID=A0A0C4YW09_9BURK|nr:Adenylate cyclase [Cupriavidus basilensis]
MLLWAYQDLLPDALAKYWRQQLGEMAAQISAPRNWDVIIDELLRAAIPPSHPSVLILLETLEGIRHRAREESRSAFSLTKPRLLISAFTVALDQVAGARPDKSETVGEFARARVETASRRLNRQLGRAMDGSFRELHQTRIQIKRLRYLLEYFSPVLTKADRKRIRRLTALQGALGELNDVVVAASYISEFPTEPEHAPTQKLFLRWLSEEKKTRRHKAVIALRQLVRKMPEA